MIGEIKAPGTEANLFFDFHETLGQTLRQTLIALENVERHTGCRFLADPRQS
jgi:hypothetical protein